MRIMKAFFASGLILLSAVATFSAQCELKIPVQEFKLANGLTFLVVERSTAPVFSGYITVGAGSANEKIGDIGTAHLFEHMMFKGSRLVGTSDYEAETKIMASEDSIWARIDDARQELRYMRINEPDRVEAQQKYLEDLQIILDSLAAASSEYVIQNEFDGLYTRNGAAEFNATTGYDFTHYFVSLPSNRLELWFAMEADRLIHPVLREFFPERDVVSEERRLSVENNADSKLFEQLIGTAFIAHPYQIFWEWQSEENNLSRGDLEKFHWTYYTPENITVAIVGDVKLDEVKKMAEKYFGPMPVRPKPEPIYTREPEQQGERRVEQVYEANPAVFIAYHKTPFDHPDEPVFGILRRLLAEGRTSRLYKALVIDQQLCLDISVDVFPGNDLGDVHASVFNIYAYPNDGVTTVQVEQAIYAELNRLATVPVDSVELKKIKNNIEADFIWASYSNIGLAGYISEAHRLSGSWEFIDNFRNSLNSVTSEDIMRVARHYFTKENRTVATLVPKEQGGEL